MEIRTKYFENFKKKCRKHSSDEVIKAKILLKSN